MLPTIWAQESRRYQICVDSYENGVLKGRFFDPYQELEVFESLSQFLIRMDQLLDDRQEPQSYTTARTFSSFLEVSDSDAIGSAARRGNRATFELQVLFRQHSSWQGILLWREAGREHSFRSVLELVILMDSALRSLDAKAAS